MFLCVKTTLSVSLSGVKEHQICVCKFVIVLFERRSGRVYSNPNLVFVLQQPAEQS